MYSKNILSEYPDVLTVKQLTEALQVGRNTAYKLLDEGKIKSIKIGRTFKIPKIYVISYLLEIDVHDLISDKNED